MGQPTAVALPQPNPSPTRPTSTACCAAARLQEWRQPQSIVPAGVSDRHLKAVPGSARPTNAASRVIPLTSEPSNTIEPFRIHGMAQAPLSGELQVCETAVKRQYLKLVCTGHRTARLVPDSRLHVVPLLNTPHLFVGSDV